MAIRTITTLACGLYLLAAAPAEATPPGPGASDPRGADSDASSARAIELYNRGVARYQAADYEAAIEAFTSALEVLGATGGDPRAEAGFLENLARAHMGAHQVDQDLKHVRTAREILERLSTGSDHYALTEADRVRVDAQLAQAQDTLATETPVDPPLAESAPPLTTANELQAPPSDLDAPPARTSAPVARGFIVAGAVMTAVGATLGGVFVWGLVKAEHSEGQVSQLDTVDEEDRRVEALADGRRYNRIAIGTGVAGAVSLATGLSLLGVGLWRRRSSARRVGVLTGFGPGAIRAQIVVRF